MSVESEDMTGKPPTLANVQDARKVVQKYRVNMPFMLANPELGVQLGNIDRCLAVAEVALTRVPG